MPVVIVPLRCGYVGCCSHIIVTCYDVVVTLVLFIPDVVVIYVTLLLLLHCYPLLLRYVDYITLFPVITLPAVIPITLLPHVIHYLHTLRCISCVTHYVTTTRLFYIALPLFAFTPLLR